MDDIDCRILRALQQDGRQTNAALAEKIGLSQSGMLDRVRRLERSGAILGYEAVIAPEAFGLNVQAFIAVRLRTHSARCNEPFEERIMQVDGVLDCYHVTGQFDYLLRVATKDLAALRELNNSGVTTIPGLGRFDTMVVLAEVKRQSAWPHVD